VFDTYDKVHILVAVGNVPGYRNKPILSHAAQKLYRLIRRSKPPSRCGITVPDALYRLTRKKYVYCIADDVACANNVMQYTVHRRNPGSERRQWTVIYANIPVSRYSFYEQLCQLIGSQNKIRPICSKLRLLQLMNKELNVLRCSGQFQSLMSSQSNKGSSGNHAPHNTHWHDDCTL